MEMLKDIGMFDTLYEKNLGILQTAPDLHHRREEKILELREQTIPSLRAEVQKSGDPMHAQLVRDFEDNSQPVREKSARPEDQQDHRHPGPRRRSN